MSQHKIFAWLTRAVASILIALAGAAILIPFLLTPDQFAQWANSAIDTPETRAIKEKMGRLEVDVTSMSEQLKKLKTDHGAKFTSCKGAVEAVHRARIVMIRDPDCAAMIVGDTLDMGLKTTSLKSANDQIIDLQKLTNSMANLERRINEAQDGLVSSRAQLIEALSASEKARFSQLDLALCLLRYGAIGAIGAIGFNIVLRLGVFARRRSSSNTSPGFLAGSVYLVGSMVVGAMLAIILVPRLAAVASPFALSPEGVSIALAAGLVGDIALGMVRKIFQQAQTG